MTTVQLRVVHEIMMKLVEDSDILSWTVLHDNLKRCSVSVGIPMRACVLKVDVQVYCVIATRLSLKFAVCSQFRRQRSGGKCARLSGYLLYWYISDAKKKIFFHGNHTLNVVTCSVLPQSNTTKLWKPKQCEIIIINKKKICWNAFSQNLAPLQHVARCNVLQHMLLRGDKIKRRKGDWHLSMWRDWMNMKDETHKAIRIGSWKREDLSHHVMGGGFASMHSLSFPFFASFFLYFFPCFSFQSAIEGREDVSMALEIKEEVAHSGGVGAVL